MPSQRSPKAVVFDLDGTLVDSRQDITASVNRALVAHGFPTQAPETLVAFVGDGARWLIARATGLAYDDATVDPVFATYSDDYTSHALDSTRLMATVAHTLSELDGLPLAICTNKPRAATDRTLHGLGLSPYFKVVVAGGDLPKLKPDPLPLLTIARRLRVDPGELVMVGDGPQDVWCGRAVGAFTVGIQDGMTLPDRLVESRPDALLDSMAGLPHLLQTWGWRQRRQGFT